MCASNERHLLGDTSGVDEDIQAAKVIDDVLHSLAHSLAISNVYAVETDIDACLLTKLPRRLVTKLLLHIHDGDPLNSNFRESLRHVETETTAATA